MRTKRAFKMKLKEFFIIFIGLSMQQIKQIILESESPTLNSVKTSKFSIKLSFLLEKIFVWCSEIPKDLFSKTSFSYSVLKFKTGDILICIEITNEGFLESKVEIFPLRTQPRCEFWATGYPSLPLIIS